MFAYFGHHEHLAIRYFRLYLPEDWSADEIRNDNATFTAKKAQTRSPLNLNKDNDSKIFGLTARNVEKFSV